MSRTHRLKVLGLRLAAVVAFFATWLYMLGPGEVSPLVLPQLDRVGEELWAFVSSAELYGHVWVTMVEIFAALSIAGIAGFIVGFWGARSELRAGVLEPLLVWGYLVPTILFYPLLLLWFGFGMSSKIAYATISAFFPIAFNCLRGFRRVDPRYINVGRAFGASKQQMDWSIKLRAALPMAAAGLKIGAALCMITVIVAEMLASSRGLGYLIRFYSQSFSTARTYAIIIVVLMVVGVFQFVVKQLLREDRFAA
jgi:ABC-type nitrate/sulfonate/bicarbonate transport system permease component